MTKDQINQTINAMCDELATFCATHGLTCKSADEMILDEAITVEQRQWLAGFIERWEAAESLCGQANSQEGRVAA